MNPWSHAAIPLSPSKIDGGCLHEAPFVSPGLALLWATSPNFVRDGFLLLAAIQARELFSRRRDLMNTCYGSPDYA